MDYVFIYGIVFGTALLFSGSTWGLITALAVLTAISSAVVIHTKIKNKPIQREIDRLKRLRDEIGALPKEGKDSVQRAKETAEWLRITMQINELENKLEELK